MKIVIKQLTVFMIDLTTRVYNIYYMMIYYYLKTNLKFYEIIKIFVIVPIAAVLTLLHAH